VRIQVFADILIDLDGRTSSNVCHTRVCETRCLVQLGETGYEVWVAQHTGWSDGQSTKSQRPMNWWGFDTCNFQLPGLLNSAEQTQWLVIFSQHTLTVMVSENLKRCRASCFCALKGTHVLQAAAVPSEPTLHIAQLQTPKSKHLRRV
jgi:hypothetical protein